MKKILKNKNSNNHSTTKKSRTKRRPTRTANPQYHFFRTIPVSEDQAEATLLKCLEYIENNEDVLTIDQVLKKNGIPSNTFYNWVNKFNSCNLIFNDIKSEISIRREVGCLNFKLQPSMALKTLAVYSREYRNYEDRQATLKQSDIHLHTNNVEEIKEKFISHLLGKDKKE